MSTSEGELELKKRLTNCPDCTNDGYACGKQHFLEGKCGTQFVCAFQEKPPTSEAPCRAAGYVDDELKMLRLYKEEHERLKMELNHILHPNGDAPAKPSFCDLVAYVRVALK